MPSTYREFAPPPGLAPWVECTWTRTVVEPGTSSTVLPDGCLDIVVWADGVPGVAGPDTSPVSFALRPGAVLGIRFRPGCGPDALGMPAAELRDRRVALLDLWGDDARRLEERLAASAEPERRRHALEDAVTARLGRAGEPDPLVGAAVAELTHGRRRVADLADTLGIGERQLLRRFDRAVGYGPKMLDRVLRLQRLLDALEHGRGQDLAWLALDLGYADQAHMTREAVVLAGRTPGDLRRERAPAAAYSDTGVQTSISVPSGSRR
jgi:AraC-like DNA-binding protein